MTDDHLYALEPSLALVEEPSPLGRLVLRGNVGLGSGSARRSLAVGDERGARTAEGASADGRLALVPDDVG